MCVRERERERERELKIWEKIEYFYPIYFSISQYQTKRNLHLKIKINSCGTSLDTWNSSRCFNILISLFHNFLAELWFGITTKHISGSQSGYVEEQSRLGCDVRTRRFDHEEEGTMIEISVTVHQSTWSTISNNMNLNVTNTSFQIPLQSPFGHYATL